MAETGTTRRLCWWLMLAGAVGAGCHSGPAQIASLKPDEEAYYQSVATRLDFPAPASSPADEPAAVFTQAPRRLRDLRKDDVWDLTLAEVLHLALQNSQIIRARGQFLAPNNPLLNAPDAVPSRFDPAIQETQTQAGIRGVEAALADFDAQLATSMLWGRDERIQNNAFLSGGLAPGDTLTEETGVFSSRLEKTFANGGTFGVNQNWDYSWNNVSARLFNSVYTGSLQADYRHPLWAGSGVEFTRIAGPLSRNPFGATRVDQGVVIARINTDITLADFEASIRNLLKDAEDLYWDLSLAYRSYDIEVTARNRTLSIWQRIQARREQGLLLASTGDEAQTRDNYYEFKERTENALTDLYQTETQLRRLLGLPVNDGRVIRPIDEPTRAEFVVDWPTALAESLTHRAELRRQKWQIKSLELQLQAAKSLTHPRLDFVSNYRVNAFGDHLIAGDDDDGVTEQGLNSAYETLMQGDQTGWNLGFELSMPVGFREANVQVRHLELRLAKARRLLSDQELEISHELAFAFQELDRWYQTAQTNLNRHAAARERLNAVEEAYDAGQLPTVDLVLRAQISLAQAQAAYLRSLIQYNKAIAEVHLRSGTLLQYDNVLLAESVWHPEAYREAVRHAKRRACAWPNPCLEAAPRPFALPGLPSLFEPPVAGGRRATKEAAPPPESVPPPPPAPPQTAHEVSGPELRSGESRGLKPGEKP